MKTYEKNNVWCIKKYENFSMIKGRALCIMSGENENDKWKCEI